MSLYSFAVDHWAEIKTNLIASALAFPLEVLVTLFIVNRVVRFYEDRRWKPARRNVAQRLFEVHRILFNAAHHVVDPGFHIDKKSHRVPDNVSQAAADHWGKSTFLKQIAPVMEQFKKTIEYNNAALDSGILPLVSDFLIAAEELQGNVGHMLLAYDPANKGGVGCFHPRKTLETMESIYGTMTKLFPEIPTQIGNGPVTILTAKQLSKIYDEAATQKPGIEYIEQP